MKISILICALPEPYRDSFYIHRLMDILDPQMTNEIEMLIEVDDMQITVGEKRNSLLKKAKGERIIFVDDDDLVTDNYVEKLLEYAKLDYDCIGIGVKFTKNGKDEAIYDFSYKKNINHRVKDRGRVYGRMPNHLCLWKTEIARRIMFPDRNLGEDHEWAEQQILREYTFHEEKEVIYHYDFRPENTQTRIRR